MTLAGESGICVMCSAGNGDCSTVAVVDALAVRDIEFTVPLLGASNGCE
jgi:hypothetical protein